MNTNLAISWVNENGNWLEKARLAHILFGTEPDPEVVKSLITLQNKNGGFPLAMTVPVILWSWLSAVMTKGADAMSAPLVTR